MTIRSWALSIVLVLFGWISLQLGVMYFTDAAPSAVALFPSSGFIDQLPPQAAILGMGKQWIAISYDGPDLGKTLYKAGALVVLPAGLPGCISFSQKG